MLAAVGWAAVAASSLLVGALLAIARPWHDRVVGVVLGFGAGALISGVAFELAEQGLRVGGPGWLAGGLRDVTGLATVVGFAVAAGLSLLA